jgi:hypothetical protein
MAATDKHATVEELLEAVFSVRSVTYLYNEGQLPLEESLETALRRVWGWYDMAASLGVSGVESVGSWVSESELQDCWGSDIVSCCCEKLVAEARGPLANPEEGERPPLEAVTRRRMRTQQAEKT